jgi:hypothetical protein
MTTRNVCVSKERILKEQKKQTIQSANNAEMPEIGKISPEIFTEVIFPRLGAKSKDIIVGPQHGVDVGIVRSATKRFLLPPTRFSSCRNTAGNAQPGLPFTSSFPIR